MPANRRRVAVTAPAAAWKRLGHLLEGRRQELGYTYRAPEFERVSGVNRRMQAEFEKAAPARINHFTPGSFQNVARGYQVTEASMLAVLRGEADALTPAPPAVPGEPPGWTPPPGAGRSPAAAHLRDRIWERLRQLALRGVAEPDGTAVFLRAGGDPRGYAGIGSPADARDWDGAGSRLDLPDRVALLADLQLADAARAAGSRAGAAGA